MMHSRGGLSFASLVIAFISFLLNVSTAASLSERTPCYSGIFILVSRGSEEPQGQSILEGIAGALTAAIPNSGSNEVVYPALLSFWNSAPTGVTNAQQQLQDYQTQCPDGKIVLLGYSQGSYVLDTALAGGNYSGETWSPLASNVAQNIAAVVLFGNPGRVLDQGTAAQGTNCADLCNTTAPLALSGSNSAAMGAYSDKIESWCAAADPICCSTGNDISAHLGYWSANTTDTVVQFVQDKLGATAANATSTLASISSEATASSAALSTAVESLSSVLATATSSLTSAITAGSSIPSSIAGASTLPSPPLPSSTVAAVSSSGTATTNTGSSFAMGSVAAACSLWFSCLLLSIYL